MKKHLLFWVSCTVVLVFLPKAAFANGFDIYEQGAKAVGMAGAFTAQADDPSAVFFNPGGITQLEGTQISAGACLIMPTMKFESKGNAIMGAYPGQGTRIKDHTWIIPNAYITQRVNDKISVGLGSFAHFGLGIQWPTHWEGRFTPGATKTVLTTQSVSPVVAIKPMKNLSIGFGPYIQYFDVELNNLTFIGVPTPPLTPLNNRAQTAESKLKARDWNWGWQAGFQLRIVERLTFGAAYLSEIRHKLSDGEQEVRSLTNGSLILKQGFSSEFILPATIRLGLAWRKGAWTIEAGGQWTEWTKYKSLSATFADGSSLVNPKNWENAWLWRIGSQCSINRHLDLRAGFFYDESPIPRATLDPLVPSGARKGYCGGFGLHRDTLTFDVAYNYIQDKSRLWNNPSGDVKAGPVTVTRVIGNFGKAYAHILSMTVTYRF